MKRRKATLAVSPPDPFPREGGEAYLLVAQARLDHQMSTVDAHDTKGGNILVAGLSEAGFLLALLAIRPPTQHRPSGLSWLGLAVSAAVVVFLVFFSLRATAVRDWKVYPSPQEAWKVSRLRLDWELARSLEEAYEANVEPQRQKAGQVNRAGQWLAAMTIVTILTAVALVFT
jgi:hypothetical protein